MKFYSIRTISILSIYLALIIALTFIPYTGYIQIGPLAITTIPVIIVAATYHQGFKGSMVTGIAFGVGSYIRAITIFPTLMSDPMLSILPRIVMFLIIYLIYKILGDIKLWKFVLLSALCVILNSILVSVFYFIVQIYDVNYQKSFIVWITLIYINFIAEIIIGIILSLPFYKIALIEIKKDKQHIDNIYI